MAYINACICTFINSYIHAHEIGACVWWLSVVHSSQSYGQPFIPNSIEREMDGHVIYSHNNEREINML